MAEAYLWPAGLPIATMGAALSASNTPFNASTVSAAVTFRSLTDQAITRLGLRRAAVTGTPPNYRVSLQGVDASGNPDGTVKSSGNAAAVFAGGGLTNAAFNWLNLTSSYTPSRGELLSWVLEYSSGTVDASNFLNVSSNVGTRANKFPTLSIGSSGVYTRTVLTPIWGYGTATRAFGTPIGNTLTQNVNSGSTDEAGAKFILPGSGTYTIPVARFSMGTSVVARTLTCTLYAGGAVGDTTPLQTVDVDTDLSGTPAGFVDFVFPETALATLNLGDTYRIAVSTPDASNQGLNGVSVTDAADFDAFQLGRNFILSTRTGGDWTDTDTSRLLCEVCIGDITVSGGGGGGPLVGPSVLITPGGVF